MIKYIKNQLKNIPMMILVFILLYGIVTIATSNINSNDITFDNTNSNLNAGDMQEAIDEVFQHATDYNEIKTTIGDSTLTTTNKTLTGAVNEVDGKVRSLSGSFKVVVTIIPYTVTNGNFNTQTKTYIDAALSTGAKFLGIVGYSTNSKYVFCTNLTYGNDNYALQLGAIDNGTYTDTFTMLILEYIPV